MQSLAICLIELSLYWNVFQEKTHSSVITTNLSITCIGPVTSWNYSIFARGTLYKIVGVLERKRDGSKYLSARGALVLPASYTGPSRPPHSHCHTVIARASHRLVPSHRLVSISTRSFLHFIIVWYSASHYTFSTFSLIVYVLRLFVVLCQCQTL